MTHTESLFKTIILLHHLSELHKSDDIDLYYIDLFCGAGGTSTGVELAKIKERSVAKVIACVNHDKNAIASHMANHPYALHFTEDMRTLDLSPIVNLVKKIRFRNPNAKFVLWASLECTNFSKAKGGQARDAECMYFKYYFEPLETNTTRIEKLQQKLSKTKNFKKSVDITIKIDKLQARLDKGREDPKYYTYRKEDVFEYCKKYDASVIRPIKDKSAQEVIDIILNAGQQPNPRYYKGCKRVGCYPCMMCQLSEVRILMSEDDQKQKVLNAESEVGTNFFPPGYIPKYACANGSFPMAEDVFKYVADKNATLDMYEPEGGYACMSMFHGLCE